MHPHPIRVYSCPLARDITFAFLLGLCYACQIRPLFKGLFQSQFATSPQVLTLDFIMSVLIG